MKVAFYIENQEIENTIFHNLSAGNPGIGGTPYLILLISSLLSSRDNGIEVVLYSQKTIIIDDSFESIRINNAKEAIYSADNAHCDYIVINLTNLNWVDFEYHKLHSEIKLIPWCHNFIGRYKDLTVFSRNRRIAKVINVSKEQMDLYWDDPIFDKSDYIYNPVTIDSKILGMANSTPFSKRRNIVTYLGALVPNKSFHVLARIWKKISSSVKDAELYIIGTGNLYSHSSKLGTLGVASKEYEEYFTSFLRDDHGEIMKNVHFLGKMGLEKYEILTKTKVGIPNPTGKGETFCISAVEMQSAGCFVTAMRSPGYFDTFINGEIVSNEIQLADKIIQSLLSNTTGVSHAQVIKTIEEKFSIDRVLKEWETIFFLDSHEHLHPITPVANKTYRAKVLKLHLNKLKKSFVYLKWIPSIEKIILFYSQILNRLGNVLFKKNI